MKKYIYPTTSELQESLKRPTLNSANLESIVEEIFETIAKDGDLAIHQYSKKFDQVDLLDFSVTEAEFAEADSMLSSELKSAIHVAIANIRTFHSPQIDVPKKIETMPGVSCWRKSVGIEKVGLYIPGGTAPLFSTVLMLGIQLN